MADRWIALSPSWMPSRNRSNLARLRSSLAQGSRKFSFPGLRGKSRQPLLRLYYQDDVWKLDKLARAADLLEKAGFDIPASTASAPRLIDENGNETGFSLLFRKRSDFERALV
jgi:hypothetical protein